MQIQYLVYIEGSMDSWLWRHFAFEVMTWQNKTTESRIISEEMPEASTIHSRH